MTKSKTNTNKTVPGKARVTDFMASIETPESKQDCLTLKKMMGRITGQRATMWGESIVGFGRYHYQYDSGREGDSFLTGFSPRKQNLSIYIMPGFSSYHSQLEQLGPHKTGRSCLYVKNLSHIDKDILEFMIADSVKIMRKRYHC